MVISYQQFPVQPSDDTKTELRWPIYSVADLGYSPTYPKMTLSPRSTPPMIGLELGDQIHPADILANA